MSFRYTCRKCGSIHEGMPVLSADAPLYYYSIPENERAERCELTSDTCVVDSEFYFLRVNLPIPVHGLDEPFSWGVWISVSFDNFKLLTEHWDDPERERLGPFFGWLSADLHISPDTENLRTSARLQAPPWRPVIELEPTNHPLAREQIEGISQERLAEIYSAYLHG